MRVSLVLFLTFALSALLLHVAMVEISEFLARREAAIRQALDEEMVNP